MFLRNRAFKNLLGGLICRCPKGQRHGAEHGAKRKTICRNTVETPPTYAGYEVLEVERSDVYDKEIFAERVLDREDEYTFRNSQYM